LINDKASCSLRWLTNHIVTLNSSKQKLGTVSLSVIWRLRVKFWFWRYLTRGLIWHLSQSSIRPSLYFSSIVKSRSNPLLEPTSI